MNLISKQEEVSIVVDVVVKRLAMDGEREGRSLCHRRHPSSNLFDGWLSTTPIIVWQPPRGNLPAPVHCRIETGPLLRTISKHHPSKKKIDCIEIRSFT